MILRQVLIVPFESIPGTTITAAILRTCETLHEEGKQIMYTKHTVLIDIWGRCFQDMPCLYITFPTMICLDFVVNQRFMVHDLHSLALYEDSTYVDNHTHFHSTALRACQKFCIAIETSCLDEKMLSMIRRAIAHLLPVLTGKILTIESAMGTAARNRIMTNPEWLGWPQPAAFQALRCKSIDLHIYQLNDSKGSVASSLKQLITSNKPYLDVLNILYIFHYCIRYMSEGLYMRLCDISKVMNQHGLLKSWQELNRVVGIMPHAIRHSKQEAFILMALRCKFILTRIFFEFEKRKRMARLYMYPRKALRCLEETSGTESDNKEGAIMMGLECRSPWTLQAST